MGRHRKGRPQCRPRGCHARQTSDPRPLTSTYSYSPCCGALAAISYSDGTPAVSFTLDRLGRQRTISDATGTRSFSYNDALQLVAETNAFGTLSRQYDALGRSSGFKVGANYQIGYGYSADGRFAAISSMLGAQSNLWHYSFVPGTDLLAGWSNNAGFAALRSFEVHRDLIAKVANTFQGQPIGSFAYANDAIARRVSRMDTGRAAPPLTNLFAYNARSELSSAQMGTNAYGYVYDPIGNRLTASNNAEALNYAANALNQYTNIISSAFSAPPRETIPLFDADGNLTNDGRFAYTWDAENRLIAAQALNQEPGTTNQLTFVYDYMSRRVAKTVGSTTHRFLYDGWAMIQEKTGTQTNSYVYGLDLSGSLQGAGMIGGILAASLNGTQAFYFYDANGNVTDLAASNGTSLAHYEWDPYGNATVSTGIIASANPFRFSTKYTDDETGLLYYGYRYYVPGVGRWVNRDPIEESGGINMFGFTLNAPVARFDVLGKKCVVQPDPNPQSWYNQGAVTNLLGLEKMGWTIIGSPFNNGVSVSGDAYNYSIFNVSSASWEAKITFKCDNSCNILKDQEKVSGARGGPAASAGAEVSWSISGNTANVTYSSAAAYQGTVSFGGQVGGQGSLSFNLSAGGDGMIKKSLQTFKCVCEGKKK
jgi:RHS repeat-associated protein